MIKNRLIELTQRAKDTVLYCSDYLMENDGVLFIHDNLDVAHDVMYGKVPPVDPTDPMNPVACLEKAWAWVDDVSIYVYNSPTRTDLCHYKGRIPTYEDYMEALLNLHDLAKANGGEWVKAWERAMNPEEG